MVRELVAVVLAGATRLRHPQPADPIRWAGGLVLACVLAYLLFFVLLPRLLARRCPRCRGRMVRDDSVLLGGRRIGDGSTPLVMKATYSCGCGYTSSRVYTRSEGGAVDVSGMAVFRTRSTDDQITEQRWEQELESLRRQHDTERDRR